MAITPSRPRASHDAPPWPSQHPESGTQSPYLATTLLIVGALTFLRLVGLRYSVVDLFYDEAQYWSWSRDLALGYYTKPPLLAWVIAAAERVCGSDEWCVRAPSPLFHGATSLVVFAIGRRLYDERAGFWAALLTALGTGVVFSSRIISTDVPLLFFWAIALLAFVNILAGPSRTWATILGVSIGLGLLAKYAMIYFLPGMALAALFSKRARLVFGRSDIWLALLLAALVVAPNIAWNAANSFATFQHTGGLVIGEPVRPSIMRGLEFLAAQFAVFGPVTFAVMIIAMVRLGSRQLLEQDRILVAFYIPALVIVTGFAISVKAYENWAAVSLVSGAVLAGALLSRRDATGWMRASVAIGIVVQVTLIGTDAIANRLALPHFSNPYRRTIGWREFAAAAGEAARQAGAKSIVSDSRSEFAALQYYWRDRPEKVLWWRSIELPSFELKEALSQSSPEPILFVTGCSSLDNVRNVYARLEPLGRFAAPIGNLPENGERVFYGFRLSGARGPIPPFGGC
jgi:4-amino-4-deoxy-L-arabinose transferase-like glycosyltransferase